MLDRIARHRRIVFGLVKFSVPCGKGWADLIVGGRGNDVVFVGAGVQFNRPLLLSEIDNASRVNRAQYVTLGT